MCYFSYIFLYPQNTIKAICHALENPKLQQPDFIVGTGISGGSLLVPVSLQSGIPFGIVRKSGDVDKLPKNGGCHSGQSIESPHLYRPTKYVIIDDFSDSGSMVKRIISSMEETWHKTKCVGVILYQQTVESRITDKMNVPICCLANDVLEMEEIDKHG